MYEDATGAGSGKARGRSMRTLLLIILLAFLAGLTATLWALSQWSGIRGLVFGTPPSPPAATRAAALPTVQPQPAGSQPAPDNAARMADLEGRIARIESGASTGAASSRAEGLLIAFAARRALDRGLELGYVEAMLSRHFGDTQPRAVAQVIAASRQPVTLEQLRAGLEEARPGLSGAPADAGIWETAKETLSGLFIVRKADKASPVPDIRFAQAQRCIESGRGDLALADIARWPNRDRAADWMRLARRHIEAHRALDLLEAAAITQQAPSLPTASSASPVPENAAADTF